MWNEKNEQSGRKSEEDEAALWDIVQPCVGREFMSADAISTKPTLVILDLVFEEIHELYQEMV